MIPTTVERVPRNTAEEVNRHQVSRTRWFASWKLWFSLLFLAIGLIAVSIWIPIHQRMQAIRYLAAHGVEIQLSSDREWLTEWFGEFGTALRSVEAVRSGHTGLSDELLRHAAVLGEMTEFHGGSENHEPLTESGVAAFQSLRNLEHLDLDRPIEVAGDEDLFAGLLAARPPLKTFRVRDTPLSAVALRELGTIESLKYVLAFTREDFPSWQPMPNLQEFDLDFKGEIDLSWLRGSPRLSTLVLIGPLSEENVRQIAELKNLTLLAIPTDVVTQRTVDLLLELPRLESVWLIGGAPSDPNLRQSMREHWYVEW